MSTIEPTQEQLETIAARPDGPVVMVNLLRYKRDADGNKVGADSYMKYTEAVTPMVIALGGKPIWAGRPDSIVIADHGHQWDAVILVEYPSPQAFLQMISSPEYLEIHHLRAEGLEAAGLIATTPGELV